MKSWKRKSQITEKLFLKDSLNGSNLKSVGVVHALIQYIQKVAQKKDNQGGVPA